MTDQRDSVHLPGPKYMRSLASLGDRTSEESASGTVAVLVDSIDESMAGALGEVLDRALDTDSGVYILFLMKAAGDLTPSEILIRGREIGDQLTAWVLRLSQGRLPRAVKIVVYWGGPSDVLTFVTSTIRPDLVTMVHSNRPDAGSLALEILRRQCCPVLLLPQEFPRPTASPPDPRLIN